MLVELRWKDWAIDIPPGVWRTVLLKVKIHLVCDTHLPKYWNPLHAYKIHCRKVEIHEIYMQNSNVKKRNSLLPALQFVSIIVKFETSLWKLQTTIKSKNVQ